MERQSFIKMVLFLRDLLWTVMTNGNRLSMEDNDYKLTVYSMQNGNYRIDIHLKE